MHTSNILNIPGKHILIVGNRSYRNLGDELILLWTVKLLLEANKKVTIAAYDTKRLQEFFSQIIDISAITFVTEIPKGFRSRINYLRQGKIKERKLRKQADAVIIGWGEILTEENKHSYRYRLASLLPCRKKPRYLMWGIQRPKKFFNRFFFKQLLKRTQNIFARDMDTVHDMKAHGFENVEFFMDTSYFAYPRKNIHHSLPVVRKYIIINLNKNAENFLNDIIEEVKHRYRKWYEIKYVPVAKGRWEQYDDLRYAHLIQRKTGIKDQQFTFLDREDDFKQFIKTLAGASIVISSRLHLFLIASFLGLETKVYPYQKKILKMQKTLQEFRP